MRFLCVNCAENLTIFLSVIWLIIEWIKLNKKKEERRIILPRYLLMYLCISVDPHFLILHLIMTYIEQTCGDPTRTRISPFSAQIWVNVYLFCAYRHFKSRQHSRNLSTIPSHINLGHSRGFWFRAEHTRTYMYNKVRTTLHYAYITSW